MQARQTAAPKVFAQLENVLAGTPLPIEGDFDPTGAWQCRYLRLGGPEGLRVFNAYRCRIYDDGAGWVLEKTSGAERLRGRFYTLSDTHLAFVGARNGPQQAQGWYGMHTTRDTVGVLERASVGTGQDRLRILFPPDQTGGTFDVMDLRR